MRTHAILCALVSFVGGCSIKPAPRQNPSIVTSVLPDGTIGRAYSQQIDVEKGSPPFTWSLRDVPDALQWLTIVPATGALGGTPTALVEPGATFTVTVTDVIHRSDSKALTLAVRDAPAIITEALPDAVLNTSYSTVVAAEGGTLPLAWSLRDVPDALQWLAIDPSTGTLGGTPTAAVDPGATFTIAVSDAKGLEGSKSFTLTVKGPPTIVTTTLPDAFTNSAYSALVEAQGGTPPLAWSLRNVTDALRWLTIDSATGELRGTATASVQSGATFTVVASDANHLEGSKALTLATRQCTEGQRVACWVLGGTGNQCMAGVQTCVNGRMSRCIATSTASTSVAHCGPGATAGACGSCDPTRANACCGGVCVDTNTDPQHCGSCSGGGSVCTNGTNCCGGVCVDTSNDPLHCGSCNNACAAAGTNHVQNVTCSGGACQYTCDGGHDAYGRPYYCPASSGCELHDTVDNCGSCGNRCPVLDANNHLSYSICAYNEAAGYHCYAPCAQSYYNCDSNVTNGCETLCTNPADCSTCSYFLRY